MMQCLAQTVFVVKKQHGEKCIVRSAQLVPNFDKILQKLPKILVLADVLGTQTPPQFRVANTHTPKQNIRQIDLIPAEVDGTNKKHGSRWHKNRFNRQRVDLNFLLQTTVLESISWQSLSLGSSHRQLTQWGLDSVR